jgi:hypothetical protein
MKKYLILAVILLFIIGCSKAPDASPVVQKVQDASFQNETKKAVQENVPDDFYDNLPVCKFRNAMTVLSRGKFAFYNLSKLNENSSKLLGLNTGASYSLYVDYNSQQPNDIFLAYNFTVFKNQKIAETNFKLVGASLESCDLKTLSGFCRLEPYTAKTFSGGTIKGYRGEFYWLEGRQIKGVYYSAKSSQEMGVREALNSYASGYFNCKIANESKSDTTPKIYSKYVPANNTN